MIFVETPTFTIKIRSILTDDQYWLLQIDLIINPTKGVRTQGPDGIRLLYYCQKTK